MSLRRGIDAALKGYTLIDNVIDELSNTDSSFTADPTWMGGMVPIFE